MSGAYTTHCLQKRICSLLFGIYTINLPLPSLVEETKSAPCCCYEVHAIEVIISKLH